MSNYEKRLEKLEHATADIAPLAIVWGDSAPPDNTPATARIMRVRWLRPDEEAA